MKRCLFWSFCCIFIVNQAVATLPDSLLRRIARLQSGKKIEALIDFATRQQMSNPRLAEEAALLAWHSAQSMAHPLYVSQTALYLGDFYHNIATDFRKSSFYYNRWLRLAFHAEPEMQAKVMLNLASGFLLEKQLDSARYFALKAAPLLKHKSNWDGYVSARWLAGNIFLEEKQYDSALSCLAVSADVLENLLKMTSPDEPRYKEYLTRMAEITGTLANTWMFKGNYRIAAREINKALAHAVLSGNRPLQQRLSLDYANILARQGMYEKSLEVYLKILKENENQGNSVLLAEIWQRIGEIYAELGDLEKSLQNLRKASGLLNATGNLAATATVFAIMGDVFYKDQQYDSADACFKQSQEINRRFENIRGLTEDLLRRGNLAMARGRLAEAETFFNEVLQLGSAQDALLMTEAWRGLALLALKKKQTDRAIQLGLKAYEYSARGGEIKSRLELAGLLAEAFAAQGDYKQAYRWLNDRIAWADSLNIIGHRKEIARLQARYDYEKKEAELALEKEKSHNLARTQRIILYFSILGILLAIIIAWLLYHREKERRLSEALNYRRETELAHTRQALMEAEMKARDLEQKQLMEDLKVQSAHLTNLALIIAQKNEFINQLKEQIKSLSYAKDDEKEKCAAALLHRLNQQHRLNADLDRFRKEVESAHQTFFKRLEEVCPSLTAHEKDLAGLLRIGLSSKDIASLNNVSVKAVEMSRYRLRKKLNLSSDESLVNFLQNLT
jgi:tetratricopeptide (TPR) repeat protein/DNA-binding NarL/FixJ family response regulator